jgi:hypothetical protein
MQMAALKGGRSQEVRTVEAVGKDAVDFFPWAANQGLMNSNTAGGLKAAVKEVLSAVEPDTWETTDVSSIDLSDYADRFERLRMSKFKPGSLQVYKSRFKNGVKMYLRYLESPSTWRYTAERPSKERGKTKKQAEFTNGSPANSNGHGDASEGMIQYPYPLRPGVRVTVSLPPDLTPREAQKLATFIGSLAVDEQAALPAGS